MGEAFGPEYSPTRDPANAQPDPIRVAGRKADWRILLEGFMFGLVATGAVMAIAGVME